MKHIIPDIVRVSNGTILIPNADGSPVFLRVKSEGAPNRFPNADEDCRWLPAGLYATKEAVITPAGRRICFETESGIQYHIDPEFCEVYMKDQSTALQAADKYFEGLRNQITKEILHEVLARKAQRQRGIQQEVTVGSFWNYDRSLDNSMHVRMLEVSSIGEGVSGKVVRFKQDMPHESYGIKYFDGNTFWPQGTMRLCDRTTEDLIHEMLEELKS